MSGAAIVGWCALPGLLASGLGQLIDRPGVVTGGLAAALLGSLAALFACRAPASGNTPGAAARLAGAFLVRVVGAVLVAATIGAKRPDLLITMVAALLVAMSIEIAVLMRAHRQEPTRA